MELKLNFVLMVHLGVIKKPLSSNESRGEKTCIKSLSKVMLPFVPIIIMSFIDGVAYELKIEATKPFSNSILTKPVSYEVPFFEINLGKSFYQILY